MDRIEVVPGLDPAVAERVVARIRRLEPSTMAILVFGSYARGTATEESDLDVRVVTSDPPPYDYRMWFEERPHGKLLHVSPGVRSVKEFLADREQPALWRWALGFPVAEDMRYLWAEDEARELIGDHPSFIRDPAPPELEDFVEFLTKVRRSLARNDGVGVRHYAHYAALLAPGLLRTLNRKVVVYDRRDAIVTALSLEVAPEHYRKDLTVAYGLEPRSDEEVALATLRLGRELLAFLREHNPEVDPQPDIARYLADGTLERHLEFAD